MKIGYLGGVKSGQVAINVAEEHNSDKLRWAVKTDTNRYIPNINIGSQRQVFTPGVVETDDYSLLILKKNKTLKFFYVLNGMEQQEVEDQLTEHWGNSDILGYDFD